MRIRGKLPAVSTMLLAALLSGCGGSFLSGAASMRVEVEVYKGPLSKEPHIQLGELRGVVEEIDRALALAISNINDTSKALGLDATKCGKKAGALNAGPIPNPFPNTFINCQILAPLQEDAKTLLAEATIIQPRLKGAASSAITPPTSNSAAIKAHAEAMRQNITAILTDASKFGTRLRIKGFYWAQAQVPANPQNRAVRIAMVNFGNVASQFGNQIIARSDALLKQMDGTDRLHLPLSVHLRDTNPTDFLNLYVWNRAAAPALWEEMLLHPTTAFSSEETQDRVRVIERLWSDENWSRINQVYASGQGDVSMAFIKDDIGNWDLKSFESDPTELLAAYTKLTEAGIKAAVTAIATPSGAGPAVSLARNLAQGKMGAGMEPAAAGLDPSNLHRRTVARLDRLAAKMRKREDDLKKEAGDTPQDPEKLKQDLAKVRNDTLANAKRILEDHVAVLNVLEESVLQQNAPEEKAPTPPKK